MATIKRLLAELKRVKLLFGTGLLLLAFNVLLSQYLPMQMRQITDGQLLPISQGASLDGQALLRELGIYAGLVVVSAVASFAAMAVLLASANRVAAKLRNRVFAKMQALPISYFDDKPAGKIGTLIINDTETLRSMFYYSMVSGVLIDLARALTIYVILFLLDWRLGLVLLLVAPICYLAQVIYKKWTKQSLEDYYDARGQLNTQVTEALHGASIIQLFSQEDQMLADFETTASQMFEADKKPLQADSFLTWTLSEGLKYQLIAIGLGLVGYHFLQGSLTISAGTLMLYLTYIMDLLDTVMGLFRNFPNIQHSLETGKRVLDFLDLEDQPDQTAVFELDQARVSFEGVTFGYAPDQPILRDISFEVGQGESLALVGHTGSGKTSIMNLLYRFYDPQAGVIRISGQDVSQFSRESLRQQMGIVLQDPYLFTGTIASNVTMNQPGFTREQIIWALEQVGAGPLLAKLPQGIDSPVQEKGSAFSSGERQLIAFARTLIANPKILILDEATSHIDTETEELIQRAMAVLKQGRTTFIIAHRLSTIQDADQILVLDKGQIIEAGNHASLLAQNGVYADMYQIQQQVS